VPAASIATPIAAGLIAACLLLAVLILPAPSRADESPLRLFASVEEAWLASDTERLASLVDTTSVRIALKPGVPPASAVTRNAAAFLFQDQLRLVKTREFRVIKLEVSKKGKARAVARWEGDWGGRQGLRTVEIVMTAIPAVGRWLLTEVRADD
jgi:hypothetical protein